MNRLSRIILFSVMGIGCVSVPLVFGQTSSATRLIHVEDIGRSVTLVGRLGKPLGTKMQIRGRWAMPTEIVKDYSPRFTVVEVDGDKVIGSVEFNIAQVSAMTADHVNALPDYKHRDRLDGQEWSMIAYETGKIDLVPDEDGEKRPVFPLFGMAYYTKPFTSQLVAVVIPIKRVWTDASGQFTVEAVMIGQEGENVVLKRSTDGKEVKLPLSKLSDADQQFVKQKTTASKNPFGD